MKKTFLLFNFQNNCQMFILTKKTMITGKTCLIINLEKPMKYQYITFARLNNVRLL